MNEQTIRANYARGLWSAAMVKMAVKKGVITQEQCEAILSEEGNEGAKSS